MNERRYAVAVDGPSGAGKSTLAKAAAERLGILYVDTGAIYRTIGLYVQRRGIDPQDTSAVLAALPDIHIAMEHDGDGLQRMLLNGEDVSADIRLPEISMYASTVSAIQGVRDFLMEMQRSLAREHSVIMDGRDIGTVVLPQATIKIYLTAAPEERARRRWLEQQQKGIKESYEDVLAAVIKRDYDDSHRAAAPLRQAEDAWLCDSTHLDFEGTVQAMLTYIRQRIGEVPCR